MVLGARARGDVDRARRRRHRALLPARAVAVVARIPTGVFEGEVVGLAGAGAFVAFGDAAASSRGCSRCGGCAATGGSSTSRGRCSSGRAAARTIRLGDPVPVRVGQIDAPRGRVDLLPGLARWTEAMAKGRKRKAAAGDVATNRQASYRYNLLERFECGIVLTGTEVKSLREGKRPAQGFLRGRARRRGVADRALHRRRTGPAARENHDPERPRKLLLHRYEIERLIGRTRERGLTLVPTRIYFAGPRSRAKVELALARGKDLYDKREAIKTREMARDVQRELREARR